MRTSHGAPLQMGEVISTHGRHYVIELDDGTHIQGYPRGKKSLIACGDRVQVQRSSADQCSIEAVDPRRTLLYRSDQFKQKLIAANVTQIAIVVASAPSFYDELVTRCLVAACQQNLRALIVLNKCDLLRESETALKRLGIYRDLGYTVIPISALGDVTPLRPLLADQHTLLVGQSGMGKSTLINALVPNAAAIIGDISIALDSGRHTTTYTRLYRMDADSALIDSPGLQEFGLAHISQSDMVWAFPEFRPLLGNCRFSNCMHLSEPGCAITCATPNIHPERLRIYQKLARELQSAASHNPRKNEGKR